MIVSGRRAIKDSSPIPHLTHGANETENRRIGLSCMVWLVADKRVEEGLNRPGCRHRKSSSSLPRVYYIKGS